MESKQKYIEDDFELDEYFIKQIHNFKNGSSVRIAAKIDEMAGLKSTNGRMKNIAGHINDQFNNPVFFVIDYYREENDTPIVLIDVREISVDKYLDFINLKKYIK